MKNLNNEIFLLHILHIKTDKKKTKTNWGTGLKQRIHIVNEDVMSR